MGLLGGIRYSLWDLFWDKRKRWHLQLLTQLTSPLEQDFFKDLLSDDVYFSLLHSAFNSYGSLHAHVAEALEKKDTWKRH